MKYIEGKDNIYPYLSGPTIKYDINKTIDAIFEEQAILTPDNTACLLYTSFQYCSISI